MHGMPAGPGTTSNDNAEAPFRPKIGEEDLSDV